MKKILILIAAVIAASTVIALMSAREAHEDIIDFSDDDSTIDFLGV